MRRKPGRSTISTARGGPFRRDGELEIGTITRTKHFIGGGGIFGCRGEVAISNLG